MGHFFSELTTVRTVGSFGDLTELKAAPVY
jgi:hypothetical protein